ncbi:MAG TPA: GFA family protein [Solirubrobacteraceae bacterium]|nr:GFA family protein [Solirubrobacteraceae bacterium]
MPGSEPAERRSHGAAPCLTGGCLCGAIRFELSEPPAVAGYCHCTRCQRRTGTGSSVNARIDTATLRILQGEESLRCWRHPDGGAEKCFCPTCGSHLFSRNPEDPSHMSVRMGAFDGDPGVRPSWRSYVAYAAVWEPIPGDGLERVDERAPR